MRINYYDDGWKFPPEEEKRERPQAPDTAVPIPAEEKAPAPDPAAVPPTRGEVQAVVALDGHPPRRRGRKPGRRAQRKEKRRSGVAGFFVCLLLIAALTGTAVWLNGGVSSWRDVFSQQFWDRWQGTLPSDPALPSDGPSQPADPDWEPSWKERDWTEDLDKTAIPTAQPAGDAVLTVNAAGETLSPGDIYVKLSPSIVGVRVIGETSASLGTGVILSPDGYIVTNAHVVAGGKEASVLLSTNYRLPARLVGYDKETDLAVLKVNAVGLPAADFGDSEALRVGDLAYAIGNPLGEELRGTMTDGIISAIDRSISAENGEMTLLQTTAALNSGNSGGALCNAAGQVIGITNMKMMSDEETIEGLGFAIPTKSVKTVVDEIIATGSFRGWPMLGVTVTNHYDENGAPDGAEVMSVVEGSDAYAKGIRVGQVIVAANGAPVSGIDELLAAKKDLQVGDTLTLTVRSDKGKAVDITVTMMSTREMGS